MAMAFKKATKKNSKARVALYGPSGSGKTYTALALACGLGTTVAVVDTERGSASKYTDTFSFDVLELESYNINRFLEAIEAARAGGYECLIIDSLSHAWMGKGGELEMVDAASRKSGGGNSFSGWRDVSPLHHALVDAILGYPGHVIVTLRSKTEWVVEKNDRGKSVPRKVGLAPMQKDGIEYEFDIVGQLDDDNNWITSKTRCSPLRGQVYHLTHNGVTRSIIDTIDQWLTDGAPQSDPAASTTPAPTPPVGASILHTSFGVERDVEREAIQDEPVGPLAQLYSDTRAAQTSADLKACVTQARALTLSVEDKKSYGVVYTEAKTRIEAEARTRIEAEEAEARTRIEAEARTRIARLNRGAA